MEDFRVLQGKRELIEQRKRSKNQINGAFSFNSDVYFGT